MKPSLSSKPFFGRQKLLREIVQGVLDEHPQDFALVAPRFCGKTRILDYLAAEEGPLCSRSEAELRPEKFRDPGRIIALPIDCKQPEAQERFREFLAEQLSSRLREDRPFPIDWDQVPDASAPSRRLLALANQANRAEFRIVLLLNNFDVVFQGGQIKQAELNELRPLTTELALVMGSKRPLYDIDIHLASSSLFNAVRTLFVGLLEHEAALTWIAAYYRPLFPELTEELDEPLAHVTGRHPFLLARLRETLLDVQKALPAGKPLQMADFKLISLRLAEHGRLLFETLHQTLQAPPSHAPQQLVDEMLARMVDAPLPQTAIAPEHEPIMSWLFNQAVVIYEDQTYRLFTPLFADFLRQRSSTPDPERRRVQPAPRPTETPTARNASLPRMEADLLRYLSQHANQVVSSQELLVEVWKLPATTSDRRVQEAIRRLRNHLKAQTPPFGVIENERGQGYRFVPAGEDE